MKALITGSSGFIGKNLIAALSRNPSIEILKYDLDENKDKLDSFLKVVDVIFHLAGVNRPEKQEEFKIGNSDLTENITTILTKHSRKPAIFLSSSIQAAIDNPYGVSKKAAEDILIKFAKSTGAPIFIYRLPNVFGKWCRPNYNSVVATFCHNIANNLEINIHDKSSRLELVYVVDIVNEFISRLAKLKSSDQYFFDISPVYKTTVGSLAELLQEFKDVRKTLEIPDLSNTFTKKLYSTYLSYLKPSNFSYFLDVKKDDRGFLFETIKSKHLGQMFVSTTKPGITRGNHYHDTKIEKFTVIKGEGLITLRNILSNEIVEYRVSGDKIEVVDIPPGYTHAIKNVSDKDDMMTLFWSSEIFNPEVPDTYFLPV